MLMQALRVCKSFARVRWRSMSYPGVTCVGEQAGMFNARALGKSAQAEQDTPILYIGQESVILITRTRLVEELRPKP